MGREREEGIGACQGVFQKRSEPMNLDLEDVNLPKLER